MAGDDVRRRETGDLDMFDYVGVAEAAQIIGERGRRISDGFAKGWFDTTQCLLIAGRRVIPMGYLHAMSVILQDRRRARPVSVTENASN